VTQKTLKFYLVVEYPAPDYNIDMHDVERAHREVFEESPGDFINYIIALKDSSVEYGIDSDEDKSETESEFECTQYYYSAGLESNICKKFGALCSHGFCKQNM
jgi:hypothetical protein